MAKSGYSATTGAAVALIANTAKTVLQVTAPAQFGVDLQKIRLSFDGVAPTLTPALVEIIKATGAATVTSGTVTQVYGRTVTAGFTTGYNATVEPTGVSVIESFLITPNGGTLIYDYPYGTTPDCPVSNIIGVRVTSPYAVNCRSTMIFERT